MDIKHWHVIPGIGMAITLFIAMPASTGTGLAATVATAAFLTVAASGTYRWLAARVSVVGMPSRRWLVVSVVSLPAALASGYPLAVVLLWPVARLAGGVFDRAGVTAA
jgi:hypothetical protein